jgi:hypothetical protein
MLILYTNPPFGRRYIQIIYVKMKKNIRDLIFGFDIFYHFGGLFKFRDLYNKLLI